MDLKVTRGSDASDAGRYLDRRQFVKGGTLAALALCFPSIAAASVSRIYIEPERRLSFYNTHTGESLSTVYYSMGAYLRESLEEINHVLRDHRTGEIKAIDRELLDLLYELSVNVGAREPFHVISGFRSLESNSFLRSRSSGVAKKSLHLEGKAVDVRIPGRDLAIVREGALHMKCGGVGYYPASEFIHLDVGPFRYWSG